MNKRFFILIILTLFVFLPFEVNAMEIFIKPPVGENISLEVESADTIEAVKEKIFNKNNTYIASNQKLFYNNVELINGRTLGDYTGISAGCVIDMKLIVNIILNANGGLFGDKEEHLVEDYYGDGDIVLPTRDGYVFKGFYTEKDGGLYLDYYEDLNIIKNEEVFYAHWYMKDLLTLDFSKVNNVENFTELEKALLQILVNNNILVSDASIMAFKDVNGKILLRGDSSRNLYPASGLTSMDNIVYNLTSGDKQILLNVFDESFIPDSVELIFVEDYSVVFDASGGTFKKGNILKIEKWENGLEENLEKPTREGYEFLGYFTEKTGGTRFELILAESGIDKNMTFYAQWKEIIEDNFSNEEKTPDTFDNIYSNILLLSFSLIGVVSILGYFKKSC